jgi:GTP-binding protein EngB required for normal cell division
MCPLNESQRGRVAVTFEHVDKLLGAVERLCRVNDSPFGQERADVRSDEARMLAAFIRNARSRMLATLDRMQLPRPQPKISARRAIDTNLLFADISLSELKVGELRGYGEVDAAAAAELEALVADLRLLFANGRALLASDKPGVLAARLANIPGVAGEILRCLEHISAEHALIETRPLISAAADRVGLVTFDIGVFGRVSTGKSSLINALVDQVVLPVGATPVTAVPLRISRGANGASVRGLDGTTNEITLDTLWDFATQAGNPENVRGVAAIDVTVPSMPPGLRYVDTPGVGSMAATGPAQAFAWLPRCDLGLVLVAAGTPVGRDELALITGLVNAGLRCRVLLSKSDLLAPDELRTATAYVSQEIDAVLGPAHAVAVHAVSTIAPLRHGLETLRAKVLDPLALKHLEHAHSSMEARLRRLISLTASSLRGDVTSTDEGTLVDFHQTVNAARSVIREATDRLPHSADDVLATVAGAVAAAWAAGDDAQAAARRAVIATASQGIAAVETVLDTVRAHVADGGTGGRRMPPLFDPALLESLPPLSPPRLGSGTFGRARAAHRLEPLRPAMVGALTQYASRLQAWAAGALDELVAARQEPPRTAEGDTGHSVAVAAYPELVRLEALLD